MKAKYGRNHIIDERKIINLVKNVFEQNTRKNNANKKKSICRHTRISYLIR